MRVCSLFCGIGGIDLAFEQARHEIVWANDNDKFACMTYRHNFPNKSQPLNALSPMLSPLVMTTFFTQPLMRGRNFDNFRKRIILNCSKHGNQACA